MADRRQKTVPKWNGLVLKLSLILVMIPVMFGGSAAMDNHL
ncbi:hypothetical protein [Paenibacillus sp. PAMC21692]|nr:hypothetical protein [Paenibacillus sp. PAMC21692]